MRSYVRKNPESGPWSHFPPRDGDPTPHGRGEIVKADAGRDKNRHRLVKVLWFCNDSKPGPDKHCKVCHGKPVVHRWDFLQSGRVVSCGRRKAKLTAQYAAKQQARVEGAASTHGLVDSVTGETIQIKRRIK
jgi:hypothetical protein